MFLMIYMDLSLSNPFILSIFQSSFHLFFAIILFGFSTILCHNFNIIFPSIFYSLSGEFGDINDE